MAKAKPKLTSQLSHRGFSHLSLEEKFLLFAAYQMGATRAARCIKVDLAAVEKEWAGFTSDPLPPSLKP